MRGLVVIFADVNDHVPAAGGELAESAMGVLRTSEMVWGVMVGGLSSQVVYASQVVVMRSTYLMSQIAVWSSQGGLASQTSTEPAARPPPVEPFGREVLGEGSEECKHRYCARRR